MNLNILEEDFEWAELEALLLLRGVRYKCFSLVLSIKQELLLHPESAFSRADVVDLLQ